MKTRNTGQLGVIRAGLASLASFSVLELEMTHEPSISDVRLLNRTLVKGLTRLRSLPLIVRFLFLADTVVIRFVLLNCRFTELRRKITIRAHWALLSPVTDIKQNDWRIGTEAGKSRFSVRPERTETNLVVCWSYCCWGQVFQSGRSVFGHIMAGEFYHITPHTMTDSKKFVVYTIVDQGKDKKGYWQRIGAAFTNKDGSLSVLLNALPVNGKLCIREPNDA